MLGATDQKVESSSLRLLSANPLFLPSYATRIVESTLPECISMLWGCISSRRRSTRNGQGLLREGSSKGCRRMYAKSKHRRWRGRRCHGKGWRPGLRRMVLQYSGSRGIIGCCCHSRGRWTVHGSHIGRFFGVDLCTKGQQKQMAPTGSPGTSIGF